jgi:conjugative relaxase-like TrwC/TraI family protein
MLEVRKIAYDSVDAKAEYLITSQTQAQGRYYIVNDELASETAHWGGSLAAELGLAGKPPTIPDFVNLLIGADPRTEKPLLKQTAQKHQPGLEMVCSIPKGWSIAWAVAEESDKERMEAILRSATERLIEVIERDVPFVRRGRNKDDERVLEHGRLLAGYFPHMTSRMTDENLKHGKPCDMQAHYHVIIPNLSVTEDGTWHAVGSYSLVSRQRELDCQWQAFVIEEMEAAGMSIVSQAEYEHQQKVELYEKHVEQMERYGVEAESLAEFEKSHIAQTGRELVERSKTRQFHLPGFMSRAMIKEFSSRERQVEHNIQEELISRKKLTREELAAISEEEAERWTDEALAELSIKDRLKIRAEAQHRERMKKMPVPSDVVDRWQTRLAELGVTVATFKGLFDPVPKREVTREMVLSDALERLPEENAYLKWDEFRGLVAESALRLGYAAGLDELRQDLIKAEAGEIDPASLHPNILVKRFGKRSVVTTRSWILEERAILLEVRRLRDAGKAPTIGLDAEKVAAKVENSIVLRGADGDLNEQGRVLEKVLTRRVAAVEGEAGTGKGVVARVWAAAWKQAEPEGKIYALAVSGKRAIEFAGEIGGSEGLTFEKFALDVRQGRIDVEALNRGAICIDEGAMANSSRLASVLRAVAEKNASPGLLLVGDPEQMKGIGASGLFQEIEKITGKLEVISENQRVDRTYDKRDVFVAAQKNIRSGDPKRIEAAIAYHRKEGHLQFVDSAVEARQKTVDYWAEHYHPEKHGTKEHPVIAGDRENWEIDTLAVACQNVRLERGDLDPQNYVVAKFDDPTKFYEREQRIFAGITRIEVGQDGQKRKVEIPGDLVRITSTIWCRDLSGQRKQLRNGDQAEVLAIKREQDGSPTEVQLRVFKTSGDEWRVRLTKPSDWDKMRLGYAVYTMGDQGSTRNHHASLLGRQTSRASFYVTDSRATRPGLLIADRQSLGVEKDADEDRCAEALLHKLLDDDHQIAAVNLSDNYIQFREREVKLMEERQIELDAEREAALEAEREEETRLLLEQEAERAA